MWTIGYGHTGPHVKRGLVWTQEQAEADLQVAADRHLELAREHSPCLAEPENFQRLAAVADFIYNLGIGAYDRSTLKKRIDETKWEAAGTELMRWVHAGGKVWPGLVRRRKAEVALL